MLRDFLIKIKKDLDVITHISNTEIRLFIHNKIQNELKTIFNKYIEKRQLELLSDRKTIEEQLLGGPNDKLKKQLTDITNTLTILETREPKLKKTQKEELKKTQKEELKKTQKEELIKTQGEQLEKKQTEELEYKTKITAIIEAICVKINAFPQTIKTTAYFNPGTRTMVVLALGRHQVDICRSIAHEMVHLRQSMNDFFGVQEIPDVGGFFEDEANAVAGQIVKKFLSY